MDGALGASQRDIEQPTLLGVRERIGVGEDERQQRIVGDTARKTVAADRDIEDDDDIGLEALAACTVENSSLRFG